MVLCRQDAVLISIAVTGNAGGKNAAFAGFAEFDEFQNFRDLGQIGTDLFQRVGGGQTAAVVDAENVFDHVDRFRIKSGALQTDFVDHFDYIVVDEVHKAGATSYLKVIKL